MIAYRGTARSRRVTCTRSLVPTNADSKTKCPSACIHADLRLEHAFLSNLYSWQATGAGGTLGSDVEATTVAAQFRPSPGQTQLHGANQDGIFYPLAVPEAYVEQGMRIGYVTDYFANKLADVTVWLLLKKSLMVPSVMNCPLPSDTDFQPR